MLCTRHDKMHEVDAAGLTPLRRRHISNSIFTVINKPQTEHRYHIFTDLFLRF